MTTSCNVLTRYQKLFTRLKYHSFTIPTKENIIYRDYHLSMKYLY
jgi:hypothetical protein